jgi:hypothetical protein
MALSNTQALCRAGILEKLIVLAQQQMKIEGQSPFSFSCPVADCAGPPWPCASTFNIDLICAGDSASIEEELRQKVLLGVANILLTYANDKVRSREPRLTKQAECTTFSS